MSTFKRVKVEEVFELKRGYDITKKEQHTGEIPIISSSGITSFHNQYKIEGPAVITGRKGTLGKVYYLEEKCWPHDTTLWVSDFKGNNPRYIYYLLKQIDLKRYDVGGANPTLNRNHIHKLDIMCTLDKKTQKKIVNKLSVYDYLIGNNTKRIKLLEETAELIYKEWFFNFRFPGHEKKQFFNGKPNDWKEESLGNFFPIITGKKNANVSMQDGKYKFFTCSQNILLTNEYSFEAKAILLAGNGEFNVKYYEGKFDAYQRTYVLIPYEEKYFYYLYEFIKYNLNTLTHGSKGSVIKYLTKDMIESYCIYKPDADIINSYNNITTPIYKQIEKLRMLNEKLEEARDILIPKLIKGEIEV